MEIETELLKSIPKEELELQIKETVKSFHGFLTREVAMRLIAKEKGILKNEDTFYDLAAIPKGERRVCFNAKVKKIWPVATYASGKKSRVVEVGDATGTKPLVLWNEDVELARTLRSKDEISVRGAYEKNGELHLGYSGALEVTSKAAFSNLEALESVAEGERIHLRGFISSIEGLDNFVCGTRTVRGFSFVISDGKKERRCILLAGIDRSGRMQTGDEIIIEGGTVRNANVELDSHSRILTRRAKDMLLGELVQIECSSGADGEILGVEVGGRVARFDRRNALCFMGLDPETSPDIMLSTVVSLKKDTLLNSKIAIKIGEMDNKTVVRC